jgi:hypothetical protein
LDHVALFAVTMHVVAAVAFNLFSLNENPVPVTAKVSAPLPDAPDAVSAMYVPTEAVSVVFTTVNLASGR